MSGFGMQEGGTDPDWDDIELELECSGREAGISGVTFGGTVTISLPWPDARWPFAKRTPA